jgi:hypothetical protein
MICNHAAGNAGLCVAAVSRAALGHVKNFSSAHSRCAVLRLLLQHLRVVMLGGFEHLAKRDLQDGPNGRNRFFLRLLFVSSFAAVIETTLRHLNMPERRLMWGAEVQSRK